MRSNFIPIYQDASPAAQSLHVERHHQVFEPLIYNARLMQVRNWTAAAILLLTLPTFAFITCEIYTQLTAGRSVRDGFQHACKPACDKACTRWCMGATLTWLTAAGQGDSRSGLRIGLRVRDAKKPGSRRSLVDRQAAVAGQDAAEEGIWPPNALSSTSSSIMEVKSFSWR